MGMMAIDPGISSVKVGDAVERFMGSDELLMKLKVTAVTENTIVCGAWTFDKATGGEIDEDLGWDGFNTGSLIRRASK
jgi:hypothetical protein